MEGTMMDYPLTLPRVLEHAAKIFGKTEIASRMPDRSIHRETYVDLHRRARALGRALQDAGLKRGDRVATLMWNHYAHMETYFGAPAAGGVLHTLNLRLHPNDIAYIANHASDRFLVLDDVLLPLFDKFSRAVNFERVLVVPLTGKPVPPPYLNYEEFLKGAKGELEYPDLDEKEAAAMCYTSGTTGRPRGVVYSHRAIYLHSLGLLLSDFTGLSSRDTLCPVVPMFHANAWGLPFAAPMVGTKLVYPGPYLDPPSLLDLFEQERVTVTAGVPSIWLGMIGTLQKEPARWSLAKGMKMIVGGSAVPESMIRAYDKFGLRVIQAWGMTETAPLGTLSFLKGGMDSLTDDEKYGYRAKQGIPAPLVEVRVVNDRGMAPWDGKTTGELQVRGPWVAARYHNLPEAGENWSEDGWFRTGDVAAIDAEGYVRITDRIKDLIKSGGEWISSVDVENAIMGHPAVAEAAVVAVPHPKWQERPLAVVVLRADFKGKVQPDELRSFIAPKFASWWLPDAIVFADELPKTGTGKVAKILLRDQYKEWKWAEPPVPRDTAPSM
ncbi:MAG: long-chain fatty acid--CoA ligase [Nitrososphaerota archaeon]|nr:long-chain fatty acid--CoA ligase [Nitrososphaerota archaeon]